VVGFRVARLDNFAGHSADCPPIGPVDMAAQGSGGPVASSDGKSRASRTLAHRHATQKVRRIRPALFRQQTQTNTFAVIVSLVVFCLAIAAGRTAKSTRAVPFVISSGVGKSLGLSAQQLSPFSILSFDVECYTCLGLAAPLLLVSPPPRAAAGGHRSASAFYLRQFAAVYGQVSCKQPGSGSPMALGAPGGTS
jgi:hypothetical protein